LWVWLISSKSDD